MKEIPFYMYKDLVIKIKRLCLSENKDIKLHVIYNNLRVFG